MNATQPNQPSLDEILVDIYSDSGYLLDSEGVKAIYRAEARIERLITEARIDELKEHGNQWRVWLDDTVDVKLRDVVAWYDLRIKELQATLTEPQGSSQDSVTPTALGHEADNSSEVA